MTANHIQRGTFKGHLLPVSDYQLEVSPGHRLARPPEGSGASVLTMGWSGDTPLRINRVQNLPCLGEWEGTTACGIALADDVTHITFYI